MLRMQLNGLDTQAEVEVLVKILYIVSAFRYDS